MFVLVSNFRQHYLTTYTEVVMSLWYVKDVIDRPFLCEEPISAHYYRLLYRLHLKIPIGLQLRKYFFVNSKHVTICFVQANGVRNADLRKNLLHICVR